MATAGGTSIAAIDVEPLSIRLREPFVIATGRIDTTRAALVRATLEDGNGRRATGLGEAAALPPVTREDQPELLATIAAAAPGLRGAAVARPDDVAAAVAQALPGRAPPTTVATSSTPATAAPRSAGAAAAIAASSSG